MERSTFTVDRRGSLRAASVTLADAAEIGGNSAPPLGLTARRPGAPPLGRPTRGRIEKRRATPAYTFGVRRFGVRHSAFDIWAFDIGRSTYPPTRGRLRNVPSYARRITLGLLIGRLRQSSSFVRMISVDSRPFDSRCGARRASKARRSPYAFADCMRAACLSAAVRRTTRRRRCRIVRAIARTTLWQPTSLELGVWIDRHIPR
jgi:hypothetical protein